MLKIITENWVRIDKKHARARYNMNQDIYIIPCKMHPENSWQPPMLINQCNSFDDIVFWYTHYNCCNELGKYPAYYITRKEWDQIQDWKNSFV